MCGCKVMTVYCNLHRHSVELQLAAKAYMQCMSMGCPSQEWGKPCTHYNDLKKILKKTEEAK